MNFKTKKAYTWIISIGWLLIFLLIFSCNADRTEKADTYWIEDEKGISTNDLLRLQKLVPFEIVLPKYLPDDNGDETSYHLTSSYMLGTKYELVIIEYFNDNYSKSFTINEQEIPTETTIYFTDYPDNENDSIITYNEIEIWEEGFDSEKIYQYEWLNNGLWFSAWFSGYTRDESREIVKSMIE